MSDSEPDRPPQKPLRAGSTLARLVWGVALLIVVPIGLVVLTLWTRQIERMTESVTEQALTFTRAMAATGNQAVQRNLYLLQETISQHLDHPDILDVDIVDVDDLIVASRHPARIGRTLTDKDWQTLKKDAREAVVEVRPEEGLPVLVVAKPLLEHGEIQAWIRVGYSLTRLQAERRLEIASIAGLLLTTLTIGVGGVLLVARYATGALKQVLDPLQEALRVAAGGSTMGGSTMGRFEQLTDAASITAHLLLEQSTQLRQAHDRLEERVRERTAAVQQSEARLRMALDASSAGTWSWDVAGNVSQWDERYHALYGFGPNDPISFETWIERVHPEDRVRLRQRIEILLTSNTEDRWNEEFRAHHPALGERWMHGLGQVERHADGRAIRFAGINIDVTERKQAEEDRRKTHALLDAVVEHIPNMIFLKDATDLRFSLLNRAGEALLGYAREELLEKNDSDFFPKEQADFFISTDRTVLESREILDIQEEPIRTKTRGIRILHTKKVPLFDMEGRPRYLLGISEDITERKRAHEGLMLFRTLLDQVTDAIEVIDPDSGRFLDANVQAWTSLGYTRGEFLSLTVPDIDPLVTKPVFDGNVGRLRESGITIMIESVHRHKNGMTFPVEVCAQLIRTDREYLVAIVRDISVRKQVESQLREREEQYRNIFEAIADPVIVAEFNEFIRDANPAACREYGYAREELVGLRLEKLVDKASHSKLKEGLAEVRAGRSFSCECLHVGKNGSTFTVDARTIPFRLMGESVVLQMVRNITARKQAEEALRQSETRYRTLIQTAGAAVISLSSDGVVRSWNPAAEAVYGYVADEVVGTNYFDRFLPDSALSAVRTDFDKVLTGQATKGFENTIRRKDGQERTMLWDVARLTDGRGKAIGAIAVGQDITSRKQAEAALSENEERLRVLYEDNPSMYFTVAPDGTILSVNRFGAQRLGYEPDELIGSPVAAIIHEDERGAIYEALADAFANPTGLASWEFRKVTKGGTVIWVRELLRILPAAAAGTGPVALIVCEDVTERKEAEEALRESEARHRSVVTALAEGIVIQNREGGILSCNASACRILGLTEAQVLGRTSLDPRWQAVHEDGSPFAGETHPAMETLRTGLPRTNAVMGVHRPDGSLAWISINTELVRGAGDSSIYGVVASFRDITESKQAEAQIQSLLDAAPDATVTVDQAGHITRVNRQVETLLGYGAAELLRRPIELLIPERYWAGHPGDRVDFMAAPQLRWMGEGRELFARHKDGREVPVEISLSPLETADGPLVIAALRDITARKQAEAALRASERRLVSFLDHLPGFAWIKNSHGRYVYVNSLFDRTLLNHAPWQGKTDAELWPPDIAAEFEANDRRVRASGKPVQTFESFVQNGERRQALVSKFLVERDPEEPELVGGIAIDVTEQQRAEALLRESHERLRKVTRRLATAEERERRRIARELHDEFGQALTGLNFSLAAIARQAARFKDSAAGRDVRHKAESMLQTVGRLMQAVRTTATALRPAVVDDLGLTAGLEWLADWFHNHTGRRCIVTIDQACREAPFGFELTSTIFRSAQELLTNVARHADASAAWMELSAEPDGIKLLVKDDGRGLPLKWDKPRSYGLRGLRERAELLGGTVTMNGKPGKGTVVTVRIPDRSQESPI